MTDKTVGLCPTPCKLFGKSLTKNFNKNRALRGSWDGYYYILVVLVIVAVVMVGRVVGGDDGDWVPVAQCASTLDTTGNDAVPVGLSSPLTDSGFLWLVNQDNPLPSDFTPQDLVTHRGIRLHAVAYTAYTQMLTAMAAESGGTHGLQLVSAFRPYEYQRWLFGNRVSELVSQGHDAITAEEMASKSLQRPGASEHQTGLALDVTVSGQLNQDFASTTAGQWLASNSHRFGFIIRYPQYKTEITQIIYEPWHIRYVGLPHAQIIWENGITLEEYAQLIASGQYIQWCGDSHAYYLVIFSEFWPDVALPGLIEISSTRYGGGVGYIITFRRNMAERWTS